MILKRMTGSKHKSYRAAMVEQVSTFAALVLGLSLITPSTPNTTARIFKCRNFNLANYFPGILWKNILFVGAEIFFETKTGFTVRKRGAWGCQAYGCQLADFNLKVEEFADYLKSQAHCKNRKRDIILPKPILQFFFAWDLHLPIPGNKFTVSHPCMNNIMQSAKYHLILPS